MCVCEEEEEERQAKNDTHTEAHACTFANFVMRDIEKRKSPRSSFGHSRLKINATLKATASWTCAKGKTAEEERGGGGEGGKERKRKRRREEK